MKIKNEVVETKYEYVQVHNVEHRIISNLCEYYKVGWEPHLFSTVIANSGTVYVTYVLKRKIKTNEN
jgi:hypothetical protein